MVRWQIRWALVKDFEIKIKNKNKYEPGYKHYGKAVTLALYVKVIGDTKNMKDDEIEKLIQMVLDDISDIIVTVKHRCLLELQRTAVPDLALIRVDGPTWLTMAIQNYLDEHVCRIAWVEPLYYKAIIVSDPSIYPWLLGKTLFVPRSVMKVFWSDELDDKDVIIVGGGE